MQESLPLNGPNSSQKPKEITRQKRLKDGTVKTYSYPADKYRKPKDQPPAPQPSAYVASKSGLWRPLVETFEKTPEYKALAPLSQYHMEEYFDLLEDRIGEAPREVLENPDLAIALFLELRNSYADRPTMGNRLIGTLKRVLSYGKLARKIDHNHAAEIPYLPRKKGGGRRHSIWTQDRLDVAMRWEEPYAIGVEFLLLTGMRAGDAVRMTADRFDGKWLIFCPRKTAAKTGAIVRLPVWELDPLVELMDRLKGRERLLLNKRGRPWGRTDAFGAAIRRQAVMTFGREEHRTVHDIRRTMITRLAMAGCSEPERASISGHQLGSVSGELGTYTASTPDMAIAAFRKLNTWLAEGKHRGENILSFTSPRKPAQKPA